MQSDYDSLSSWTLSKSLKRKHNSTPPLCFSIKDWGDLLCSCYFFQQHRWRWRFYYVFVIQKDEKLQYLEPNMKIRDSVFNASEAFKKFIINILPVRLCSSIYGATAVRSFASWFFVRKHTEPIVFVVNNQVQSFQLHDEFVVNFDLGGCSSFSLFSV